MKKKFKPNDPIFLLATCFGIGKIPFAPGTWGSLAAVLFFWAASYYLVAIIILILPLLFVGVYVSGKYMTARKLPEDPGEIVIDEFVGQLLAIVISLMMAHLMLSSGHDLPIQMNFPGNNRPELDYTMPIAFLSFGLFRFFDIVKPFPISWVDRNIKGGAGVMYDDALAGVFAGFSSILVFWAL